MRKQELIHIHGLLAELCRHYEEVADNDVNRPRYREFGVHPTSIHKSKTDHKHATFTLADALTDNMKDKGEAGIETKVPDLE